MSKKSDIIKIYTQGGCYRFASIAHILTGWIAKDFHRDDLCSEKLNEKGIYQYEMSSCHAFVIDHDGNAFDVHGKKNLDEFSLFNTEIRPELVGTVHNGRLWMSHCNYVILDYNVTPLCIIDNYKKLTVFQLFLDNTYRLARHVYIDELIKTIHDVVSIIEVNYDSTIIEKVKINANEMLFILKNEKRLIDWMNELEELHIKRELIYQTYKTIDNNIITSKLLLNDKQQLFYKITQSFINYKKIKDEGKQKILIANAQQKINEHVKSIEILTNHLLSFNNELLIVKQNLLTVNIKLLKHAFIRIAISKKYMANSRLYSDSAKIFLLT